MRWADTDRRSPQVPEVSKGEKKDKHVESSNHCKTSPLRAKIAIHIEMSKVLRRLRNGVLQDKFGVTNVCNYKGKVHASTNWELCAKRQGGKIMQKVAVIFNEKTDDSLEKKYMVTTIDQLIRVLRFQHVLDKGHVQNVREPRRKSSNKRYVHKRASGVRSGGHSFSVGGPWFEHGCRLPTGHRHFLFPFNCHRFWDGFNDWKPHSARRRGGQGELSNNISL